MNKFNEQASLSNIFYPQTGTRKRASSYDVTGGNDDRMYIKPGATATIADIKSPGIITHIWITMQNDGFTEEKNSFRKVLLQFYWDNQTSPSVQAPIGDFFGMGHGISRNFVSEPLQMSPQDGKALNCWFPMPFNERALLTVKNECDTTLILYYNIDYEVFDKKLEDILYFHALWNREMPTKGIPEDSTPTHRDWCFGGTNTTGEENYVLMEAKGKGHYVGCNINIHNLSKSGLWNWPGEGDEMIFIDDEPWPPRIHGTGTEDYVNLAWCPTQEYCAPYHGLILGGKDNWKGLITYYRYHIKDPINFESSIKVTIEHGHNNHRSDDWSTTAYWYQTLPHVPFKEILPVEKRLPIEEEQYIWDEIKK